MVCWSYIVGVWDQKYHDLAKGEAPLKRRVVVQLENIARGIQ